MQISLHFEELLCKDVFLFSFSFSRYVSHSVVEGTELTVPVYM